MRIFKKNNSKHKIPCYVNSRVTLLCALALLLAQFSGPYPALPASGQALQQETPGDETPSRGSASRGQPANGATENQSTEIESSKIETTEPTEVDKVQSASVNQIASCNNGPDDLSGTVWRDYNSDGIKGSNEPGYAQVVVTAYDKDGIVGTATSDDNGYYNFASIFQNRNGDEAKLRLEFSGLPNHMAAGVHGTDSKSTVQFHSVPGCYANVAVQNPAQYCEDNPDVAISCFVMGDYNGPNSNMDAVVSIPYDATGHAMSQISKLTKWSEIGAVYGAAWNRKTERLYFSAYHKRYVGFGPNGPDAIYQLDRSGTVQGVIELDALLGSTDTAGADVHNLTTLGANGEINDEAAYSLAGRTSFGDLEISDDASTLYVVNLQDAKIYGIDISAGDVASAALINTPGGGTTDYGWTTPDECGAVAHRPFGLAWHEEKLWVGSVCESNGSTTGGNSYIHSLDPSGNTFELEVMVPLSYSREGVYIGSSGNWNAWSNNASTVNPVQNGDGDTAFPQAILADIEFDTADGSMILGIRDRWGDQTGSSIPLRANSSAPIWGNAGGDILRVCNTSSGWQVEGSSLCPTSGANKNSGPGGSQYAEYYNWDFQNLFAYTYSRPTTRNFHSEITQGGLAQVANRSTIMTTAMNPFSDYSGGVLRFENAHGRREGVAAPPAADQLLYSTLGGGYTLFDAGDYSGGPPQVESLFGKANGLGDIEAMCQLAPLEIGNYVWLDSDNDGTQGPHELPLANVTVSLYNSSGAMIASAVTNSSGNYYFVDQTDPRLIAGGIWQSGAPSYVGVAATSNGGLMPLNEYQVRVELEQPALSTSSPTQANQAPLNDGNDDLRDSDGDLNVNAGFVTAIVMTGEAGINDHSIDFGFAEFTGRTKGRAWDDLNEDGLQDAGEPGTEGVTVNVRGDGGTVMATAETESDGSYVVESLPPGTYVVEFDPASHLTFAPQDQGNDDTIDSDPDTILGRTEAFSLNEGLPEATYDVGLIRQQDVNYDPQLPSPGEQVHGIGEQVHIILTAIDSVNDVLLFEATGLPPGISIDSATGELSGSPTATGRYDVTITVHDDRGGSTMTTFIWTIAQDLAVNCDGLEREAEEGILVGFAKTVLADGASNDQHILVPEPADGAEPLNMWNGPNEGYKARFCFTVETAGIYRIAGTVRGSENGGNSFYVQVDGAPHDGYLWDVVSATDYITDYVSHRDVADPVEVSLATGQHEIEVYLREDGTRLDKLALELVLPTTEETTLVDGCGELVQEAEEGMIYGGMTVMDDPNASGGKYIEIPEMYGNNLSGGPINDKAEFCFTVPADGTYRLLGTVLSPNENAGSFYVTVASSPNDFYLWDTKIDSAGWVEDYLNDRYGADPVELTLAEDQYLITVYLREDGTKLDKIALVDTATLPVGRSADADVTEGANSSSSAQNAGNESNVIGTLLVNTTFDAEPRLAGINISLSDNGGFEATSTTNNIGKYYVDDVPPGDYTVSVEATNSETGAPVPDQNITVTEAQTDATPVETSVSFEPERSMTDKIFIPMLVE